MSWTLLCAWEDARVWAYWNHPFDKHLHYLGPVFCSAPILSPSGYTVGGGCSDESLVEGTLFVSGVSSVSSALTLSWRAGAVAAWRLSLLCFLENRRQRFPFTLACPFPPLWGLASCCMWPTPDDGGHIHYVQSLLCHQISALSWVSPCRILSLDFCSVRQTPICHIPPSSWDSCHVLCGVLLKLEVQGFSRFSPEPEWGE